MQKIRGGITEAVAAIAMPDACLLTTVSSVSELTVASASLLRADEAHAECQASTQSCSQSTPTLNARRKASISLRRSHTVYLYGKCF